MPEPYFEKDAATLILTGSNCYPGENPLEKTQVVDRSAGGTIHVESLGIDIQRFRLVFKAMQTTLFNNLVAWFQNTSDGAANSFTYYDETGADFTVRLISNPLIFRRISSDLYQGEILLEEVD